MNSILRRRRALMGVKSGGGVPAGYVTDGLVFFLDGKQQVSANSWTDLVGGKTFTLTDCSVGGGGVVFNGSSSYGVYSGALSSDWESETVEAAFETTMSAPRDILNQPLPGISLRLGSLSKNMRVTLRAGGEQTAYCKFSSSINAKLVSGIYRTAVVNKAVYTTTDSVTPAAVVSTTIGVRNTSESTYTSFFPGTIYAIRIYNRQLTEAEMLQNQQADIDRYGITI